MRMPSILATISVCLPIPLIIHLPITMPLPLAPISSYAPQYPPYHSLVPHEAKVLEVLRLPPEVQSEDIDAR